MLAVMMLGTVDRVPLGELAGGRQGCSLQRTAQQDKGMYEAGFNSSKGCMPGGYALQHTIKQERILCGAWVKMIWQGQVAGAWSPPSLVLTSTRVLLSTCCCPVLLLMPSRLPCACCAGD
jgi:hypothetical protein